MTKALEQNDPSNPWIEIDNCPFMEVVEVCNAQGDDPVRATRGYATDMGVHNDTKLFTSVFTPHPYFPLRAGQLVCPTHWRKLKGDA